MIPIIFGSLDFQLGIRKDEKFLGDKNMPISTVEILKYVQRTYTFKWFWTIFSLGAPDGWQVKDGHGNETGKDWANSFSSFKLTPQNHQKII